MATITIQRMKERTARVQINLDQWERLADIFGFYQPQFLSTLKQSLKESRSGKVRNISSLRELE
ncbi:MAG: hypothetical protein A2679_00080 [Candidatus Sungbacteria bacterium RIFCSPHIGHO2_01_FULL_54_26]|uniref:Uncharacterized protein n=1 Tax=Candidatus Sungbacteria bacterium RIFCSPHIGHO2_02_FULL_53_17 TaxID=1802275 RepID=A0A1G2KWP3_9BACT|nr:MAG: hypothetical protein A2679_00080 [Candidatus Sungbacteria bacterium RIFCSPHIGHO2_01_FULL_54_26]OHA03604.1 MAG: hypothetical protein A3C92_01290 [Candidatus Sungbacteria bacterium RIFCSPHIGHO2_02_FULL_53_17]